MNSTLSKKKESSSFIEWEVVEQEFLPENNYKNETIFSVGNGYLGMRGNFEEGLPEDQIASVDGTYVNGFYESAAINYCENAYGYAEKSQTMLNVTNGKIIKLIIEDEEFNMLSGEVTEYRRSLNLKNGILKRTLIWSSPKGHKVLIDIERIISLTNKHLMVISYEVTPLNFNGVIKLISGISGDVRNKKKKNDPRVCSELKERALLVDNKKAHGNFALMVQKTLDSNLSVSCAMENELVTDCIYCVENKTDEFGAYIEYHMRANPTNKVTLYKYIAYEALRRDEEIEIAHVAKLIVTSAKEKGFEYIKRKQKEFLKDFWYRSDIEVKGDLSIQQAIRFNMFHLLQSVGRDGKTNIPAKGLTGEGYSGHYFWDTEIYVIPFFLFNNPQISRKLLEYRYSILDIARDRARTMSHKKGALFPCRTINGEECSIYYPTGTAQYHINADIAYAIKKYMEVTEDNDFIIRYGAEILFETARLWIDLGSYIEKKDNKFCINGVTGPDEYTTLVNNNFFTNIMARENLRYAYKIAEFLKENYFKRYAVLKEKIDLEEYELDLWRSAADNMYLPRDENFKLIPQDDNFFNKPIWDFENTPKGNYPLMLHYHPLVINRYQVCKQADLILAMYLLRDEFTLEEKRINYDYYEKITTHDSSLSHSIFSIVASDIGYHAESYKFFKQVARMDLDDFQGNVEDGVHTSNMAGTWLAIVNGFAGMKSNNGILSFKPYLPNSWEEYTFKIAYRGRLIEVYINKIGIQFKLLEGSEIEIFVNEEKRVLN